MITDNQFLLTQIENKLYRIHGSEFQSFFEDVMEKYDPLFLKVRPYGRIGDKGNDGYTLDGTYYQVYAPLEDGNHGKAVKKFIDDFENLQSSNWDGWVNIKRYKCVLNDKFTGETYPLIEMLTNLRSCQPDIEFNLILAKDIQQIIEKLSQSNLKKLGFNLDTRPSIQYFETQLKEISEDLQQGNIINLLNRLQSLKRWLDELNNECLNIHYLLLEARIVLSEERLDDSIEKLNHIIDMYPNNIQTKLYLAAIYLSLNNPDKNKGLLEESAKINSDDWFYKYQLLMRSLIIKEPVEVDLNNYDDPYIQSSFLKYDAAHAMQNGDFKQAKSYISKAINLQPQLVEYKILKLECELQDLLKNNYNNIGHEGFVKAIEDVKKLYLNMTVRTQLIIEYFKCIISLYYFDLANSSFELNLTNCLNHIYKCYFNSQIDGVLSSLFYHGINFSPEHITEIIKYLMPSKAIISNELASLLMLQFLYHNNLNEAKTLFQTPRNNQIVKLINDINQYQYDEFLDYIISSFNPTFIERFLSYYLVYYPDLRFKFLNGLPDTNTKTIQLACYYYDIKDIEKAYSTLTEVNFNNLIKIECNIFLEIIRRKKAYEFEIKVLTKLKELEKHSDNLWEYDTQIFFAYSHLDDRQKVIFIGPTLLSQYPKNVDKHLLECILANTIIAYLLMLEHTGAKYLLEKYPDIGYSKDFLRKCKLPIYLNTNNKQLAIQTIVDYFILLQHPTSNDYAELYQLIIVNNPMPDVLKKCEKVTNNCFVKIKNQDKWYFIGNGHALGAMEINANHSLYSQFFNKKINDNIEINKYTHRTITIEYIYMHEEYIFWQIWKNHRELANDGALDRVTTILLPLNQDNTLNSQELVETIKELTNTKEMSNFFESYKKDILPFALLAQCYGGILPAIKQIESTQSGYINCSMDTVEEQRLQKLTAYNIILGSTEVYLDVTSIFFLIYANLLQIVLDHIPNIKITTSTFNFIGDLANINNNSLGIYLDMHTEEFKQIDADHNKQMKQKFKNAIAILNNNYEKMVISISDTNRIKLIDNLTLSHELIDTVSICISDNSYIITEDPRLLVATKAINQNLERSCKGYCSSIDIIKELVNTNLIEFEAFLDYHYLLTKFRFRFLSISIEYLKKAIFGSKKIICIDYEKACNNLKKLNLPFVLSAEYGVSGKASIELIGHLLYEISSIKGLDNSLINKILPSIIEEIPVSLDNKLKFMNKALDWGRYLLNNNMIKPLNINTQITILENMRILINSSKLGIY